MTFYTDTTPPAAYTGSLETGIGGIASSDDDRIKYALYQDTDTWSAWTDWAEVNGRKYSRVSDFSSTALQIIGYWDSIPSGNSEDDPIVYTKSFMCLSNTATGTICMEAFAVDDTWTAKTYRFGTS